MADHTDPVPAEHLENVKSLFDERARVKGAIDLDDAVEILCLNQGAVELTDGGSTVYFYCNRPRGHAGETHSFYIVWPV